MPAAGIILGRPGAARVPPEEKKPDTTEYSGRIAARIKELRQRRRMSRVELQAALEENGCPVSLATVYGWENGNKGIHPDKYPAIAAALGCKSVRSFLPEN